MGLLQKRIKQEFGVKAANIWIRHDVDEVEENLTKIVEEMKKEFPIITPGYITQDSEGNTKRGELKDQRWVDSEKALEWFEKWLADEE